MISGRRRLPDDDGAPARGLENATADLQRPQDRGVPLYFDSGYMDVPFSLAEEWSVRTISRSSKGRDHQIATNIIAMISPRRWASGNTTNTNGPASIWTVRPGRATRGARATAVFLLRLFWGATPPPRERAASPAAPGTMVWQSPDAFSTRRRAGATVFFLKPPGARRDSARLHVRAAGAAGRPDTLLKHRCSRTATNHLKNAVVRSWGARSSDKFWISGEYYRIDVNRQGWQRNFDGDISGSWASPATSRILVAKRRVSEAVPEHVFTAVGRTAAAALRARARYSTIDLKDRFTQGRRRLAKEQCGRGRQQTVYAGRAENGIRTPSIRLMLEFLNGNINKRSRPRRWREVGRNSARQLSFPVPVGCATVFVFSLFFPGGRAGVPRQAHESRSDRRARGVIDH